MTQALLFDLDDTLVVEQAAVAEQPSLAWLRGWAPTYRREAWRLALAEQGVDDDVLAEELGERFGIERRALCVGKPDAAVFRHALAQLDCDPAEAVMIGDSLRRDIEGALAAGMGAVWLNRSGANGGAEVRQIATLSDLPAVL